MTSDVVLTAALRNNLLSLQGTQTLIDRAQLRLATGLKVNSALDNPQNFFASEALKNRASDLTRLLDGVGQNIQVIKAADNGVSALTKLVEQADSVAQNALDALAQGSSEARATGDKNLSGITDITSLSGVTTTDTINFTVINPTTDLPVTLNNAGVVTLTAGDSIEQIVTQINDLNDDPSISAPVIEASIDADGQLEVRTQNGGSLRVDFVTAAVPTDNAANLALAEAFGFGTVARIVEDGGGNQNVEFTASADTVLRSVELFAIDGAGTTRASRSDVLFDGALPATSQSLENDAGTELFGGLDNAADQFTVSIDGGTTVSIGLNGVTIQGLIDTINNDASINTLVEADFDDATSQITIRSLDATVQDITIGIAGDTAGDFANFGFGVTNLTVGAGPDPQQETIRFGAGAARLAELEGEFDNIRTQIDQLVTNGDTGFRGTNLLNGDDLSTFFNESRTSSLVTNGVTFNASGLGLNAADFADGASVSTALADTRAALDSVRNFGTTLANDLAIIQTREVFTKSTVNTLVEGSDKLTIADQNEEGAQLLALQTRQQLGVTSLALASQSQQSILRLF